MCCKPVPEDRGADAAASENGVSGYAALVGNGDQYQVLIIVQSL
jgi:hypothetical protein